MAVKNCSKTSTMISLLISIFKLRQSYYYATLQLNVSYSIDNSSSRRTFYMRGLYITSVAYWHLGHFEAKILNVTCHKYMITLKSYLAVFFFVKLFIFESSSFSFIMPKVQGLFNHIKFQF